MDLDRDEAKRGALTGINHRICIEMREKNFPFSGKEDVSSRLGVSARVNKLLSLGTKRIVINLEQARYIDSAGLGALIETHRTTKEKGGRLTLCSLGPNFRQALECAKLLPVFETFPNEAAAVQSFEA